MKKTAGERVDYTPENTRGQEARGRDRLTRVTPQVFTHGGYRSTTGQTTRFSHLGSAY